MKTCIICNKIDCNLGWHEIQSEIQTRRKENKEEFNPYDLPQHWLSDYPKPPKYHEGSDRGATDEGW